MAKRTVQQSLFGPGQDLDVGDVEENVTWVLEQYPVTRDSYKRLLAYYWREFDGLGEVLDPDTFDAFLEWFDDQATSPKTIQNRAGEVQNKRPDLEASSEVAGWRSRQARAGVVK